MKNRQLVSGMIVMTFMLGGLSVSPISTAAAKWQTGMPRVLRGNFTSRYLKSGGFRPTLAVGTKKIMIQTSAKSKATVDRVSSRRSTPVSYLIKGTYRNGGRTYLRMMFNRYQGKIRVSYKNSHLVNGQLKWTKHYAGWFYQK